jgi:thermitase
MDSRARGDGQPVQARRHAARRLLLTSLLLTTCGTWGVLAEQAQAAASYRPGIVLVGFRHGVTAQQRLELERSVDAKSARALGVAARPARLGSIFALRVPASRVMAVVGLLRRDRGLVRFAEPDYLSRESAFIRIPDDHSFSLEWGSLNTGQAANGTVGSAGKDDRAAEAWTVTTGSPSIVVAEVDTGVDYTHPDLAANVWTNPGGVGGCPAGTHGYNVVAATCDPMDDDTSYGGHGTHVAGIIGASGDNGIGVAGMNWRTTILPVKWLDSGGGGSTDQLISALDWVLKAKQAGVNVRVVNDSATFVGTPYSQALSDEIDLLGSNDILFVTAAGNSGQDVDIPAYARYPCAYKRPTEICVTASDEHDKLPAWANWGANTVDLAAPGNDIYSTLRNTAYGYISGGSMAAAQVSGAAALILSIQDMSTPALKADILGTVDRLPALSGLVRTGGRLDVCKAITACAAPPVLKSFSLASHRLRIIVRGKQRSAAATKFRFALNEPASVVIVIQRRVAGRMKGRRCVAVVGTLTKGRRCVVYVGVAKVAVAAATAGRNTKRWAPLHRRRVLPAGTYRAVIQAHNNGGSSKPRSLSFRVVDVSRA